MVYLLIFIFKILENALGTLRMILISGGKKQIGAILQLIISFIWILSTSLTLNNIINDYFKIVVFMLGSYIGSLIGSIIEEKLALGSNLIMVITNKDCSNMIRCIRKKGFALTSFKGKGINKEKSILIIVVKRKLQKEVLYIIKRYDNEAMIITNNTSATGGYY